jgi:serine/threonine-protein kinase RsbW
MILEGEFKTLELQSQSDSLSIVENLIDEVKNKYSISEDMYGNMLVAITEAVTNAIYHGNAEDATKKVIVAYTVDNGKLTFKISDQGVGFDFYNLPDPTSNENVEKESGRGIFLMKHLSDQLIFSDQGRTVELTFKIV